MRWRQLHGLDHNREKQLARLKRQLEGEYAKAHGEEVRIYKHPISLLLAKKFGKDKRGSFVSGESTSYVGRLATDSVRAALEGCAVFDQEQLVNETPTTSRLLEMAPALDGAGI